MRRVLGTPIGDYLPALGLWLATAAYMTIAYRYEPAVRAFPVGVAWIMLLLLALDLASRTGTRLGATLLRWLNPTADASEAPQPVPAMRQLAPILWLAGFTALLVVVGILAAVPLYVFAALRWRGRISYRSCLIGAAGATLFIWLLFSVVLRLPLYSGLIAWGG